MSTVKKIAIKRLDEHRATFFVYELDGVRIGLRFRHVAFLDRWALWLVALDGTEIAGPIMLMPGLDLLLPYKHDERVPPGQLFVRGEPPTKNTADKTSTLRYRPVANVTEPTPA